MPGRLACRVKRRHDRRRDPPPDADQFPQLSRGDARYRRQPRRAHRTERRRQDQPDRGDLLSGAGARACAAPPSKRWPLPRATAPGRSQPRSRACSGLATLGTGIEPPRGGRRRARALCRIDREPVGSAAAFADHLRVVWLTPAMDQLFAGPASERRRFLDRLVLAVDAEHQGRVNALERALRSRNRLLEDPRPDPHWLDAIEHETAELAVAVAAQRAETVQSPAGRAGAAARTMLSRPPRSRSTAGWSSSCRSIPRSRSRSAIAASSRTTVAATPPPAARSTARISPISRWSIRRRDIAAADASTGEQKALLIGLVLAHARPARRDDRLRAGAAARRGGGASRSRAGARRSTPRLRGSARRFS